MRRTFFSSVRDTRPLDSAEPVRKRLVASFNGNQFTAEREGDELKVYEIGGETAQIMGTDRAMRDRQTVSTFRQMRDEAKRIWGKTA